MYKRQVNTHSAVCNFFILVFSGGIGENSPQIRERICTGLEFLGIELDEKKNKENQTLISTDKSKVKIYVIQTNEELIIAKSVNDVLNNSPQSEIPHINWNRYLNVRKW